jgi:hypothetical protein
LQVVPHVAAVATVGINAAAMPVASSAISAICLSLIISNSLFNWFKRPSLARKIAAAG